MHGIGRTLVRLPVARALIAGAAILAGASLQRTAAQSTPSGPHIGGDEVAMAMPRVTLPGGAGLSLPRPLPPSQAAILRRIFALQTSGDIPAALRAGEALDNSVPMVGEMLGHVLAHRYLGPHTRPGADQLRAWLERYADQPDAPAIRRLLILRMPAGESAPPLPDGFVAAAPVAPVPEESEPADTALRRNAELDRSVWATARARGADGVERLLRRADVPSAEVLRGGSRTAS